MYLYNIISNLGYYWYNNNCSILQPINTEIGAATFHYITTLKILSNKKWNICYVQSCYRPSDNNFSNSVNKITHYYQFQVIIKPTPVDIKKKCLMSLNQIGINKFLQDIKFVHNDWNNPTLGAWGIGWEIRCNNVEIIQYTYMQQLGSIECSIIPIEITYGIERLGMQLQNKSNIWDLIWDRNGMNYSDLFLRNEIEFCHYGIDFSNMLGLINIFKYYEQISYKLIKINLIYPAYSYCLKAAHIFNILNAKKKVSITERQNYIIKIRKMIKECCFAYLYNNKFLFYK